MICWYCHWGWPVQVADIYRRYSAAAEAIDSDAHTVLDYGPGHIVWADENFEDHSIRWCLTEASTKLKGAELELAMASLRELLEVPEEIRCCQPENYDGSHPENYPPPPGIQMDPNKGCV